jgi:hypothetical protein
MSISKLRVAATLLAAAITATVLSVGSAQAGFNCNHAVKFVPLYGKVWGVDRLGRYHLCPRGARQ